MTPTVRQSLIAVATLALMLALLGHPSVQRTQEARVLETAREMLGQPLQGWMIPRLNGQLRLEKPPLAYWLAAIAFEIGGVSECVGRVPFALFGWGTLLVTWSIARRMFGVRAGYYTAAALLGGLMFARHARLAETDILAVFFVTAAVACILRGIEGRWYWLTLSGLMVGLAILAKGLPAIFAIVFLVALAAANLDWRLLWRLVLSGAPVVALLVGLPWFLYVQSAVGLQTIADEAEIGMRGMEHKKSAIQYIPQLLQALAPWTALTILALALAAASWKSDRRLRTIFIWAAAVIVPLCFAGQKQYHYLFPAIPALAVLSGWLIDRTLDRDLPQWEWARALAIGTFIVLLVGSAAIPFVGRRFRGTVAMIDWIVMLLCLVGSGTTLVLARRRGLSHAMAAFAIATALTMTVLTQAWMPSLRESTPRALAANIRAVGPGPYFFYGDNVSLPTVFYLQQLIPRLLTSEDLSAAIAKHPEMIVIAQTKSGKTPPPVPDGLERAAEITADDQLFEVYRVHRMTQPPTP